MAKNNKPTAAGWKKQLNWDENTWKKFLIFSGEEAEALVSQSETYWAGKEKKEVMTWDDVPLNIQNLVFEKLQERLVGEGVPAIHPDDKDKFFIWRMRQAIRTKTQGYHNQDKATSQRRFYDPVLEAAKQCQASSSAMPPRP